MNFKILATKCFSTLLIYAATSYLICTVTQAINKDIQTPQKSISYLCEKARSFWRVSTDSTKFYANLAYDISLKDGSRAEVALANRHLGIAHLLDGEHDGAAVYLQQALDIYNELGDKHGISAVLNNFGNLYNGKGNFEDALYFFNKSLDIRLDLKNPLELSTTLNNIGLIFLQMGDAAESAVWFRRSMDVCKDTDNQKLLANVYDNLGLASQMMDSMYVALIYHREAYQISQQNAFRALSAKVALNLCDLHHNYGLRDSAEYYLNKALSYLETSSYFPDIITALLAKANHNFFLNNHESTILYAEDALSKAESCGNLLLASKALKLLRNVYALEEDYERAFHYYDRYENSVSSIRIEGGFSEPTSLRAVQQDLINERLLLEKKAKENSLKESNVYLIFFIVLALLMIGVTLVLTRSKAKREKAFALLRDRNEEIRRQQNTLTANQTRMADLLSMKDKIFSILSHDLRGPLADLKNMFILIEEGLITEDEKKKVMERLKEDLDHSTNMLDNLLRWSSIQMKNESVKPIPIHVKSVINEAIELYNSPAFSKDITIEVALHDESVAILCDLECFKFSIRNLLSNAIKFTPSGGLININSAVHDLHPEFVVIEVTDNGIGMTATQLKNLFTNSVKSSMGTRNEKGAGLGLLLSKEMVEKNGGILEVTSTKSKGTTFSIAIPKFISKEKSYYIKGLKDSYEVRDAPEASR